MPYNPQQTYVGGQLLQRGFEDFGDHLVQAFDRYEKHSQAIHQFDATRDMLANMAGPDGKPWLDQKAAERLAHFSGREKAAIGGGVLNMVDLMSRMAERGAQRVDYPIGEKTFRIPASEAAQLEATKTQRIPTEVGGKTIDLPPSSAASAELEKQRLEQAKQPKGLTQQQLYQQQQDKQKAFQKMIEDSPENKFTKDYKLAPRDVLTRDVLDPSKQAYRLFTQDNTEIPPEYDQYGIARVPSTARGAPTYWTPVSGIFRENKIRQKDAAGNMVERHVPDPSGEHVNIGGQRIPFSEIQGIKNRHDTSLKQAVSAIQSGAPWQDVAKRWDALGYDVNELPEPATQ